MTQFKYSLWQKDTMLYTFVSGRL